MRQQALRRCLRLMDRLANRRATLQQLAEEYAVTTRTIRRDLDVLEAVGIRVRSRVDEGQMAGVWWVER